MVETICSGFPLTGWLPRLNAFPACLKRPAHSLESACKLAIGVNKSVIKQVTERNDTKLADEVWWQSVEEADKGWTWFDESGTLDGTILAKRFGLRQAEKIHVIDDCSIGGFNVTCVVNEKMKVHSVDETAECICWCMTHLGKGGHESSSRQDV